MTITLCDFCGKKIVYDESLSIISLKRFDGILRLDSPRSHKTATLCPKCTDNMEDEINSRLNKGGKVIETAYGKS